MVWTVLYGMNGEVVNMVNFSFDGKIVITLKFIMNGKIVIMLKFTFCHYSYLLNYSSKPCEYATVPDTLFAFVFRFSGATFDVSMISHKPDVGLRWNQFWMKVDSQHVIWRPDSSPKEFRSKRNKLWKLTVQFTSHSRASLGILGVSHKRKIQMSWNQCHWKLDSKCVQPQFDPLKTELRPGRYGLRKLTHVILEATQHSLGFLSISHIIHNQMKWNQFHMNLDSTRVSQNLEATKKSLKRRRYDFRKLTFRNWCWNSVIWTVSVHLIITDKIQSVLSWFFFHWKEDIKSFPGIFNLLILELNSKTYSLWKLTHLLEEDEVLFIAYENCVSEILILLMNIQIITKMTYTTS